MTPQERWAWALAVHELEVEAAHSRLLAKAQAFEAEYGDVPVVPVRTLLRIRKLARAG